MSFLDRPVSVTEIIREILSSNALYYSALQSGIANYAALARKIKPEVEKCADSDVNIGTIVAGLKRVADILKEHERKRNHLDDVEHLNRAASNNTYAISDNTKSSIKISLIGNIIDVDLKDEIEYDQISNVLADIFGREIEYSLFQTDKRLRLFAENFEEIGDNQESGWVRYVRKIKKGLSKITITIPSSTTNNQETDHDKNTFGILTSILHILYNHQLPLQDAFLTSNKIVLILSDKDAAKTYEILRTKMAGQ